MRNLPLAVDLHGQRIRDWLQNLHRNESRIFLSRCRVDLSERKLRNLLFLMKIFNWNFNKGWPSPIASYATPWPTKLFYKIDFCGYTQFQLYIECTCTHIIGCRGFWCESHTDWKSNVISMWGILHIYVGTMMIMNWGFCGFR